MPHFPISERAVLDHGHVRLVDAMGDDLSIVRAARVSYDADWRTGENEGDDRKLLAYLLKNDHTSPFEAVTLTWDIKAPIFVLRQWHRHRTWSYNEVSARYTQLKDEFYVPDVDHIGTQSKSNKQMRVITPATQVARLNAQVIGEACAAAFTSYQLLLSTGCPREIARGVLPLNTYSHMFATVNLHNLFRFLKLRLHPHAQWEIRQYAEAMLEGIEPVVPVTYGLWKEIYGHGDSPRAA